MEKIGRKRPTCPFLSWKASSMCSKMNGWLQIFLSCISVFIRALAPPLFPPFCLHSEPSVRRIPLACMCLYSSFCSPDMSHLIRYSTLSGSCDSTSFFRRRRRKGLRTLWRRRIIRICKYHMRINTSK
ncbi:hypothetical protein RvY_11672 [Ramazzottius varieornatus]|uniref:Uncharacterized protein n=1 Tax=Ramazzottius varieornatus TaxID=947166 RepID=A0A1D1VPM5_RAMVA|nr:hypothetical protein RvY_11672 [Ramazzottius varieornatus]